jgi:hypothetical protein
MATKNTHGAVNVWKNLAVEYRGKWQGAEWDHRGLSYWKMNLAFHWGRKQPIYTGSGTINKEIWRRKREHRWISGRVTQMSNTTMTTNLDTMPRLCSTHIKKVYNTRSIRRIVGRRASGEKCLRSGGGPAL